jgi:hypothetical protein
MKITKEHFAYMKAAIEPLADGIPSLRQAIIIEGRAKDVEMRLRWDMVYKARLNPWICDNLYSYMNNDDIDTALRTIMREIESELVPSRGPRMG